MMREARERLGLTLREVAAAADVSIPYVCDMETGRRAIPAHRVEHFARALGVDVDDLASFSGVIAPDIAEALKDPAFARLVRGLMGAR